MQRILIFKQQKYQSICNIHVGNFNESLANECVVLRFGAEMFRRQNDLVMFFTYVAPENSPIYTTEDNGIIILSEKISDIVLDYPQADIFLSGDLNSRISNFQDFIPNDDLQFVFGDTDYPSDTFNIHRESKDETYNRFGTYFVELCCTYGIHVFNGRLFNDKRGEITCTANNANSIVDYMVASSSLFDSILHFQVGNEDFSDHFPLNCILRIGSADTGTGDKSGIYNIGRNLNGKKNIEIFFNEIQRIVYTF